MPHRLSKLCALIGARLIHVSTDCVFSGSKGGYANLICQTLKIYTVNQNLLVSCMKILMRLHYVRQLLVAS